MPDIPYTMHSLFLLGKGLLQTITQIFQYLPILRFHTAPGCVPSMLPTPSSQSVPAESQNSDSKRKRTPLPSPQPTSEAVDPDSPSSASSVRAVRKRIKIQIRTHSSEENEMEDESTQFSDDYVSDDDVSSSSSWSHTTVSTWINTESEFVIKIKHETIPEDPLLPKVTNVCVMCDKPATVPCMWCGRESDIGWCSSSHVREFENIHSPQSPLCNQFAHEFNDSQRPGPDYRRLVYFPKDGNNPVCC